MQRSGKCAIALVLCLLVSSPVGSLSQVPNHRAAPHAPSKVTGAASVPGALKGTLLGAGNAAAPPADSDEAAQAVSDSIRKLFDLPSEELPSQSQAPVAALKAPFVAAQLTPGEPTIKASSSATIGAAVAAAAKVAPTEDNTELEDTPWREIFAKKATVTASSKPVATKVAVDAAVTQTKPAAKVVPQAAASTKTVTTHASATPKPAAVAEQKPVKAAAKFVSKPAAMKTGSEPISVNSKPAAKVQTKVYGASGKPVAKAAKKPANPEAMAVVAAMEAVAVAAAKVDKKPTKPIAKVEKQSAASHVEKKLAKPVAKAEKVSAVIKVERQTTKPVAKVEKQAAATTVDKKTTKPSAKVEKKPAFTKVQKQIAQPVAKVEKQSRVKRIEKKTTKAVTKVAKVPVVEHVVKQAAKPIVKVAIKTAVAKASPAVKIVAKPTVAKVVAKAAVADPKPAVAGPKLAVAGPKPAVAGPKPAVAGPKPAVAGPKPAVAGPKPAVAGPKPAAQHKFETKHVAAAKGERKLVVANPEGVVKPVAASAKTIATVATLVFQEPAAIVKAESKAASPKAVQTAKLRWRRKRLQSRVREEKRDNEIRRIERNYGTTVAPFLPRMKLPAPVVRLQSAPEPHKRPVREVWQWPKEKLTMTMVPQQTDAGKSFRQPTKASLLVQDSQIHSPWFLSVVSAIGRGFLSMFSTSTPPSQEPKAALRQSDERPQLALKQDISRTEYMAQRDQLADVSIHDAWVDQETKDAEVVDFVKREDRALRFEAQTPKEKPHLPAPTNFKNDAGSTHISSFWQKLADEDEGIEDALQQGGEDVTEYARLVDEQDKKVASAVSELSGPSGENLAIGR